LYAEEGVEWEGGLCELVCVAEFVLGWCEAEEGGAFEVFACFERWGGGGRDEGGEEGGGDGRGELGEFGEEEEGVDVGGLGDLWGGEEGGAVKEGEGGLWVWGYPELAH
jgi:hypothetical protein